MKPTPASILHASLLAVVTCLLVLSAWELPHRPYLGLGLSGDLVAAVDPGGPGERAGIRPGDRLTPTLLQHANRDPMVGAVPGEALPLDLVRGGQRSRVVVIPEPMPDGERRLQTGLIALACAFLLLGGWVWSERRDGLTSTFDLLCLALACLLVGPPRATSTVATLSAVLTTVMSFLLPALLVHFFALFPDFRARGRRWVWVRASYAVAALLASVALVPMMLEQAGVAVPDALADLPQKAAAVWFLLGTVSALVLFGASYVHAGSADDRRRLRVAWFGSLLGLAPFAAVIAVRNVSPGTAVPGERWAAGLVLLVPASFAWAIVVHKIFDVRVALRAAMTALLLATIGVVLWAVGEWATARGMPQLSAPLASRTLTFLAIASALAGPTSPWIRSLGRRMVPEDEAPMTLLGSTPSGGDGDTLLRSAAELVTTRLRLDGCAVATLDGETPRMLGTTGEGPQVEARVLRWAPGATVPSGPIVVDQAPMAAVDREALSAAGVTWLLPVGRVPMRALLLLGRRHGGTWLDRRESLELERWAAHLAVALENALLRRDAFTHVALERELREAGAVQAHLLPQRVPVHPTLDCAAMVLSSEPVGGDYFDFVEEPERRFTLAVGDAAGKGMPAALLLAHVQVRFRVMAGEGWSPGVLLGSLNRELLLFAQPEKFVGMACARMDVRAGRMWIAVGGLEPPLLRRSDGAVRELDGGGGLLGVSRGATFPETCIDLGTGDLVLLYTDGLTEARRGSELFGRDRLRELLARHGHRRAEDVVDALVAEVRAFADRPLDDLTVVVLKQLAAPVRPKANGAEPESLFRAQVADSGGRW